MIIALEKSRLVEKGVITADEDIQYYFEIFHNDTYIEDV